MELQASLHKWYLPLFLYTHFAYDFQEEILVPGYVSLPSSSHYSTYTGPFDEVAYLPNLVVPEHAFGAVWVTFFGT